MAREVSESCVESLQAEIVSYCSGAYANKPELAARRIEAIGFQVGHQLSERYTMDRPRFTDNLDAIKFICKDFWSELFKKQIDNLKTNHRGTFVLQDNRFKWLVHTSIDPSVQASGNIQDPSAMAENKSAQVTGMHLYFPCGIIRGALSNLGIACAVSADISKLPACQQKLLIATDEQCQINLRSTGQKVGQLLSSSTDYFQYIETQSETVVRISVGPGVRLF